MQMLAKDEVVALAHNLGLHITGWSPCGNLVHVRDGNADIPTVVDVREPALTVHGTFLGVKHFCYQAIYE